MERNSFIFYKSFYDAFKGLEPELRLQCYDLISEYALLGIEPGQENAIINMVFTLIKPQIDANTKRYENGCKGGRPRKNAVVSAKESNTDAKEPAELKPTKKAKANKFKNLLSLEDAKADQESKEQPKQEIVKQHYGLNGNVLLSDDDYAKLIEKNGESDVKEAIEVLDNYIESLEAPAKKKYMKKNHKACMYTWVFDRVAENKARRERLKAKNEQPTRRVNNFVNFPQNDYDFAELERQLVEN